MSRIRSKDTGPELAVRASLRRLGVGYRVHVKGLPGTPDVVMAGRRTAVFVHGCFWHGHAAHPRPAPKTRTEFWVNKIAANKARDARNRAELESAGWRVLVVWECWTKDPAALDGLLSALLGLDPKP
jgi:DNA mismatch endonuclease (patch repair protein)